MKTSAEIMSATGIKSTHTLIRWQKAGLIPKSSSAVHPSGRGRVSMWEDWVIGRCEAIIEARNRGDSIQTIKAKVDAHQLGTPPDQPALNLPKSTTSVLIYEAGRSLGLNDDTLNVIQSKFLTGDYFEQTKTLEAKGINPILVYRLGQVRIVADYELSHMLAGSHFGCEFIVLPLGAHMKQAVEVEGSRTVYPAAKVTVFDGTNHAEARLERAGDRLVPITDLP